MQLFLTLTVVFTASLAAGAAVPVVGSGSTFQSPVQSILNDYYDFQGGIFTLRLFIYGQ